MEHPDLAPSDFYLFPNLKKFVAGRLKRFGTNEKGIAAVNGSFEDLPQSHFRQGDSQRVGYF